MEPDAPTTAPEADPLAGLDLSKFTPETIAAIRAARAKPFTFPKSTITREEREALLEEIRRRNQDPEYRASLERSFAEAEEVRRQINAQELRWSEQRSASSPRT